MRYSVGAVGTFMRGAVNEFCAAAFQVSAQPSISSVEHLGQASRRLRALSMCVDESKHAAQARLAKCATDVVDACDSYLAIDDQHRRLVRDAERADLLSAQEAELDRFLVARKQNALFAMAEPLLRDDACSDLQAVRVGHFNDDLEDVLTVVDLWTHSLVNIVDSGAASDAAEVSLLAEQVLAWAPLLPKPMPKRLLKRIDDLAAVAQHECQAHQLRQTLMSGAASSTSLAFALGTLVGMSVRRFDRRRIQRLSAQSAVASAKLGLWHSAGESE
jgi:hypothetical protein